MGLQECSNTLGFILIYWELAIFLLYLRDFAKKALMDLGLSVHLEYSASW
jgi:hypothetical protein